MSTDMDELFDKIKKMESGRLIQSHQIWLQIMGQQDGVETPLKVELALCARCNQSCMHCSNSSLMNGELLPIEIIREVLADNPGYIVLTGGEPLLHPNFIDIVYEAKRNNAFVRICTNGTLLNSKCVDTLATILDKYDVIQVSFDSVNKEVYKQLRGREHYDIVARNINYICKTYPNLKVELHCVPNQYNYKELVELYLKACDMGVSAFSVAPLAYIGNARVLKKININCLVSVHKELLVLSRERKTLYIGRPYEIASLCEYAYAIPNNHGKPTRYECDAGRTYVYINSSGDVFPCVYMQYNELYLGRAEDGLQAALKKAEKILLSKIHLDDSPCMSCDMWGVCNGGCLGISYGEIRDLMPGFDDRCTKNSQQKMRQGGS